MRGLCVGDTALVGVGVGVGAGVALVVVVVGWCGRCEASGVKCTSRLAALSLAAVLASCALHSRSAATASGTHSLTHTRTPCLPLPPSLLCDPPLPPCSTQRVLRDPRGLHRPPHPPRLPGQAGLRAGAAKGGGRACWTAAVTAAAAALLRQLLSALLRCWYCLCEPDDGAQHSNGSLCAPSACGRWWS